MVSRGDFLRTQANAIAPIVPHLFTRRSDPVQTQRRTSQHQSAREETEEKKSLKTVMFDSQVSLESKGQTV